MPLFSYLFGIQPWELDRLSYQEWWDLRHLADEWREGRLPPS